MAKENAKIVHGDLKVWQERTEIVGSLDAIAWTWDRRHNLARFLVDETFSPCTTILLLAMERLYGKLKTRMM
jgi:hypothetical protein